MGGCFSDKKIHQQNQRGAPTYEKGGQATQNSTKVSQIMVDTPLSSSVMSHFSSPIANQDIIEVFNELCQTMNQHELQQALRDCQWRKITLPYYQANDLWAACNWKSPTSPNLEGKCLLYQKGRNTEHLIGGIFSKNKILSKQKYFKIFSNKAYYIGELNNEFSPHGMGQLHTSKTEYYKGEFNLGIPNGSGIKMVEGKKFQGKFKNGQIIQGTETTEKGTYSGNFKNNKKNGRGLLRMNSGLSYEGQFDNNKKSGHGKLTKNGEILYDGDWEEDKQISKR